MKTCSRCQSKNLDTATVCYQCKRSLQRKYLPLSRDTLAHIRGHAATPPWVLFMCAVLIPPGLFLSSPWMGLALTKALLCNVSITNPGQVQPGQSGSGKISLGNCGGLSLNWHAQSNDSSRLKFSKSSGKVAFNGTDQIFFTMAASQSDRGPLSVPVMITSDGGHQQVQVTMRVILPPKLCGVQSINLGQVQPGQSRPGSIPLSNCGDLPLKWQAQGDDPSRLGFNQSSGTLAPNGTDQISLTMTASQSDRGGPLSAHVTITSNGGTQQATVTITVLAGVVGAPRTLILPDEQSLTVPATGQGTTPGTQAIGPIILANYADEPLHMVAGTILTNTRGCTGRGLQISLDSDVYLPANRGGRTPSARVKGHVVLPGTVGNIRSCTEDEPAFIAFFCGSSMAWVAVSNGFAGGTDPQPFTFVQQSDINRAANSLKAATTQVARTAIEGQLQPNEHLLNEPQCNSLVTSNHQARDRAATVTVTVQTTCTAKAST